MAAVTEKSVVAEWRHWLRGDVVVGAALAMIAAQLVWKYDLVRRTYFRQDDFTFIARGLDNDLTWDYLMRVDYGHLMPGPFAIQWAMGRLGVYNDVLAHVIVIGLQGAAGLALLRFLRLLFGSRPAILVPLGFYLITPMTISALSWWAVAIEMLPFQIALPMALSSHVLFVRTGRYRHAVAAAAWAVFAMTFYVKAPFILVLAFVLTAWLGFDRRQWRAWLLYAGVLAAYSAIFFRQLFTSVQLTNDTVRPTLPDAALAARFAWNLLSGSLVPTSLGGPWRWLPIGDDYAIAAPLGALVWVCVAVAAVVVLFSAFYRRRAWLAWLTLLAYVALADVVPVMIGRIQQMGPDLGGFELRYVASSACVLAIVIGLAFVPLAGEERPWRRRPPTLAKVAAAALACAFVAGSVWSVAAYARRPLGEPVESYIETARLALKRAPGDAVVLDRYVPGKVVYPIFFYDYALASRVLGPIAPQGTAWARRLNGPMRNVLAFDDAGRLRPVNIEGLTIPRPTACQEVGAREVRFRLPLSLPKGEWTVQAAYLNPAPARLAIRLGSAEANVEAGKDFGWTFATIIGEATEVGIRALGGSSACVGEIKVGVPTPAKNGTPVPLQPVEP
ncbi:hypothetical protein [Nonomuraea sp. bgisy101]|uniref:hypothetical protein n=1 Tax=Nonomuraea sp. bgisy101 TaxID=3413784 RepID=UPI003D747BEC